jgi:SAM-dependent methyltransferase
VAILAKISGWKKRIQANRRQLELDLLSSSQRRYCSPIYYGQYRVTLPLMQEYVKGRLLDLGCGDSPFKDVLLDRVTHYDSLDLFPRSEGVTYVSDIQDMAEVPTGVYDSAICLEVLEHVPDPFRAIGEIYRILAPGGTLIVSVPHLSHLHDEPHDYYRYTQYGLTYLLEQAGFTVTHLHQRGGLFSFLGHQVSSIMLGTLWRVPVVRRITWFLNSWLITRLCYRLDMIFSQWGIFASGYTAVARKP